MTLPIDPDIIAVQARRDRWDATRRSYARVCADVTEAFEDAGYDRDEAFALTLVWIEFSNGHDHDV